jgi:hypothetical protein
VISSFKAEVIEWASEKESKEECVHRLCILLLCCYDRSLFWFFESENMLLTMEGWITREDGRRRIGKLAREIHNDILCP